MDIKYSKILPAKDSEVVHLTGTEEITGQKTFTNNTTTFTKNITVNGTITSPTIDTINNKIDTKADDNKVVHLDDTETITGSKTFTNATTMAGKTTFNNIVNIPNHDLTGKTITELKTSISSNKAYADTKADDNKVVHLSGTETITGSKTFTQDVNIGKNTSSSEGGQINLYPGSNSQGVIIDNIGDASFRVFGLSKPGNVLQYNTQDGSLTGPTKVTTTNSTRTSTGFKIADSTDLAKIFVGSVELNTTGEGNYIKDLNASFSDGKLTITRTKGYSVAAINVGSNGPTSNGGQFVKDISFTNSNGTVTVQKTYGTPTNSYCTYCSYCTITGTTGTVTWTTNPGRCGDYSGTSTDYYVETTGSNIRLVRHNTVSYWNCDCNCNCDCGGNNNNN